MMVTMVMVNDDRDDDGGGAHLGLPVRVALLGHFGHARESRHQGCKTYATARQARRIDPFTSQRYRVVIFSRE